MAVQNKKNKFRSGFTLMEVMVSISIILVGLLGGVTLLSRVFANASAAASRLIAANLAQEGVEVVKNIRDSNADWMDWYNTFSDGDNGFYAVQYDTALNTMRNDWNQFLKIDASGLYNYNIGLATGFKRAINIFRGPSPSGNPDEIRVQSVVTWNERGTEYRIVAEDRLWNWK